MNYKTKEGKNKKKNKGWLLFVPEIQGGTVFGIEIKDVVIDAVQVGLFKIANRRVGILNQPVHILLYSGASLRPNFRFGGLGLRVCQGLGKVY